MKIAHFVENLERGGLERVVIDLATAQHRAGHECRVICLFEQGALASELLSQGIPVDVCGKRPGLDLRAVSRARVLLRSQRGGVLHTHNDMAHYYAALATGGLGLSRLINTRHSMSSRNGAMRREWFYRRSMRVTDFAVAVSEAARRQLQAEGVRPRQALLNIPNGIHTERFAAASAETRRALAELLGVDPATRLVGTVGRLNPVKDQATLIRAFRALHGSIPKSALVLVGDGALRGELETLAQVEGVLGAVHFLGDRHDVPALLPGFDLFVLSSLTEGYSMALLEACASAVPIVATDVGGNAEIVRQDWNGSLVRSGDDSGLASAMQHLLEASPTYLQAMGQRGREWVLSRGSFEHMAEQYGRLYGV